MTRRADEQRLHSANRPTVHSEHRGSWPECLAATLPTAKIRAINRVANSKTHLHRTALAAPITKLRQLAQHPAAAKSLVVTPKPPTAFTMPSRRTSRAAAKRAQQALGMFLPFRPLAALLLSPTPCTLRCLLFLSLEELCLIPSVPQHLAKQPFCNQLPSFMIVQPSGSTF